MIISRTSNLNVYKNENYKQNPKQNVAFGATVPQIKTAIEKAQLCPGKRKFFENLVATCENIQKGLTKSKVFNLNQQNKLPQNISQEAANDFKKLNGQFQTEVFSCGTKAECTCGKGKTLGEFVEEFFAKLGLNKPGTIELKPQK